MSWDATLIRPNMNRSTEHVLALDPLGDPDDLQARIAAVFAGAEWLSRTEGLWESATGLTEISLTSAAPVLDTLREGVAGTLRAPDGRDLPATTPTDGPVAVHFCVRGNNLDIVTSIRTLARKNGWVAIDDQTGQALPEGADVLDSFAAWAEARDLAFARIERDFHRAEH
ncbi:hypothetical protein D9V34_11090 [Mycetocola lacteus]|uniref:Uncharacterized protein n=1 Tax=Mycetocola lacteus TaxID=76637 RepID=A0A3L7AQS7_9MICO|nr:hypothetical protein [Mycetocola lacteus]RLP82325.1 hypothetical protein D9V34_11090 [Mycetocola lacteus]